MSPHRDRRHDVAPDPRRQTRSRARARIREGFAMRLASVRDGDIVEVNDGLPYLAVVRCRRGRRLVVDPIVGNFSPAPVKAADVVAHRRKVRPRKEAANGNRTEGAEGDHLSPRGTYQERGE